MHDSIEFPPLQLPQIPPSSNSSRSLTIPTETNSFEQWRADIHRQLEEDLQRQVQQVLEESERQERLAKLRRQYLRAGQRKSSQSSESNARSGDPISEIERRNQRILYPLNAKESYGSQNHQTLLDYSKSKLSSNSFNLESLHSESRRRRRGSQRTNEHSVENAPINIQKFYDRRIPIINNNNNNNNNSSLLFGNSILKTNKADILNILEQQSNLGENANNYVNKYGVVIDENGPFWPRDYRILYPTPRLLSRELTPKEFYLIVTNLLLSSE